MSTDRSCSALVSGVASRPLHAGPRKGVDAGLPATLPNRVGRMVELSDGVKGSSGPMAGRDGWLEPTVGMAGWDGWVGLPDRPVRDPTVEGSVRDPSRAHARGGAAGTIRCAGNELQLSMDNERDHGYG